jgi:MFS superfamily sulfate permease-like transporter
VPAIFGLAFGCFLLSYVEGISVARTFAVKHKDKVDANQELFANGAINLGAGLFRGFPVGGSMSRSAVNESAGSKTPLAGGFAAIIIGVVLLVLTAPFEKLPEATLAAIVLVAIRSLVNIPAIKRLWRLSRIEFAAAATTFAGVLCFDLLSGVLIGAAFSILVMIGRISKPHVATLGRIANTNQFADVARHPENEQIPSIRIIRVDDDIFYANTDAVKTALTDGVEATDPPTSLVVLDLASTPFLDLAGIDMLSEAADDLNGHGTALWVAGATGEVRDALRKAGVGDKLGPLGPGDSVAQVIQAWQQRGAPAPVVPERDGES